MKDAKLKNLALAAVIGLFVGACAHQESNQISGMENDEGAASSETASLGDSLGDTGSSSNGEVPAEMAPLPASSTGNDAEVQASTGNMDNLAGVASTDAMPTDGLSSEGPSTEVAAAAAPETSAAKEPTLVAPANEAPKAKAKVASSSHKASRKLTLPTSPVERKDELLNRFYIARPADSAEKLSELMYGNKEKANDLKAWNPGSWKTGSLIYYLSPLQPADGEMRSFYTERGMVPTEYEVKHGDTLATIAVATYGSKDSWKEIGLLNNIQSPDSVEPGRRLALFPANLSGYSLKLETTKSANNTAAPLDKQIDSLETQISKLEADIKKEAPAAPVATADTDKSALEAGVVGSKPLIGDGEHKDLAAIGRDRQKGRVTKGGAEDEGDADLASSEVTSFFKANLTMILGLVFAVAALGIFMFVRRSRNEHSDV